MDTNLPLDLIAASDRYGSGAQLTRALPAPLVFILPGQLVVVLYDPPPGFGPGPFDISIGDTAVLPPTASFELPSKALATRVLLGRWTETVLPPSLRAAPSITLGRTGASPTVLAADLLETAQSLLDTFNALPAPAGNALLQFLVTATTNLLRLGRDPHVARLLHQLASGLASASLEDAKLRLRPLTSGENTGLSLWSAPGAFGTDPWYLLTPSAVRRLPPPLAGLLVIEGALPTGAETVILPSGRQGEPVPAPFLLPRASPGLPQLLASSPGAEKAERGLAAAVARRLAVQPTNERLARLLRDRRLLTPLLPSRLLDNPLHPVGGALEIAVSDGAGGVFVGGWLRDPFGLIGTSLALRDPLTGVSQLIPTGAIERLARPDLTEKLAPAVHGGGGNQPGFIAHLPNLERATGGPVTQWSLDLLLSSDEAITLTAPPSLLPPVTARDTVLRSVHPAALRHQLLDRCIMPAVARLQRAALAAIGTPEVVEIGRPVPKPRVAVVIPLYKNLRFLRFQIAAFAADPAFRADAQLVFVLDFPEQRAELEHQLRGLHGIYDLPVTMVVMAVNGGYASACNTGVSAAHPGTETILLLNSDVIPTSPGWLRAMLRSLDGDKMTLAVGPKLLFEDGSVQHAGLFFAREGAEGDWLNGHYGKGMPRQHASVTRPREVPGVTGAALLVRRAAFHAAGGLCTDYVVGDYEDSDLCLRLRALGGTIRYVPAAELYHFERQSIVGHGGYARTLACAHNRRLHHQRWDGAITGLMASFAATNGLSRGKR